ncbi:hypothetical protein GCM10009716_36780 [Streptomyces sodiiphilus]|uniref:Uncharacterized protein n=2 Tax=Streptomyces sodiiphilus TaxID=226217 RepID=A0ABP5B1J6_9ACTN
MSRPPRLPPVVADCGGGAGPLRAAAQEEGARTEHHESARPRTLPAPGSHSPVSYATLAHGDMLEMDGRQHRIAAIVQDRSGFTIQFADTRTVRVLCPPEVCRIDDRLVRLDEIPVGRCLWCPRLRPLVPVGHYVAQSGREVTVYACTGCLIRHDLLPLASRPPGTGTEVRRRTRRRT